MLFELIQRLTDEMAELRLKYTEIDASRRRETDRLKAQIHLQHDNTSAEKSSPLLQHPIPEVLQFIFYK